MELPAGPSGMGWSVCVRDVRRGVVVAAVDEHVVRRIASVGKVLLLVELARRFQVGALEPSTRRGRTS